jgi:hypothetical protein
MIYDDCTYKKSTCEKYTLRFNKGWDWAVFTIDETGIFQCHSSFGDYNYHWTAFGDSFKKFLTEIDSYYLLNKVANEDYFDLGKYQEKAKAVILALRKKNEINREQARELWEFVMDELEGYGNSYDLVCKEIYENSLLNKVYRGDVFYSDFAPERDYSPRAKAFAHNIFPKFVEVLKAEIGEQTKSA